MDRNSDTSLNARLLQLRTEALEEVTSLAAVEQRAKETLRNARINLMEAVVVAIQMGADVDGLVKATGRSENTVRSWARMHEQEKPAPTTKVGKGKTMEEAAKDITRAVNDE